MVLYKKVRLIVHILLEWGKLMIFIGYMVMAGVKCPHCGELMEGKIKKKEVICCISCRKPLQVTEEGMMAYEMEKEFTVWDYIRTYGIITVGMFIGLWVIGLFLYIELFGEKKPKSQYETTQHKTSQQTVPSATPVKTHRQKLAYKVAYNKTQQYEIAKGNGDKMKTCVLAGHVAEAYLQALDNDMYKRWKSIESQRCQEAGVSR